MGHSVRFVARSQLPRQNFKTRFCFVETIER